MTRLLILIFIAAMFCSCEKAENNLVKEMGLANEALMNTLNGSKWILSSCPSTHTINLNGYPECEYFLKLEFNNEGVSITHNSELAPTQHHICVTDGGTRFPLSVQSCSNTTWSPWFHWDITHYDGNTLKFNLQDLDFYDDYKEEFTFEKI